MIKTDTAIILAGGLGTRLKPLTDIVPKPLLRISGRPMLEHLLMHAREHGIKDFIFSVGYKANIIKDYFGDGCRWDVRVRYSIEDEPLGTGGAVRKAARSLNEPFVLMWGDNLHDVDLLELEREYYQSCCPMIMTLIEREDVENFGVAKMKKDSEVRDYGAISGRVLVEGFVEKPLREIAPSRLVNAGIFIIAPAVLEILPDGRCSMEKDCFEKIAPQGKIAAYIHRGQWWPTDNLEKYRLADSMYRPI